MYASELMIGDWFEWHPDAIPADKHFEKVTIKTLQVLLRSKKHCDCCNPIPLTAEILEANGFEYCEPFDDWCRDELYICRGGNAYYISLGHNRHLDVSYAHQLQHALRLCGLNELADNFKVE